MLDSLKELPEEEGLSAQASTDSALRGGGGGGGVGGGGLDGSVESFDLESMLEELGEARQGGAGNGVGLGEGACL